MELLYGILFAAFFIGLWVLIQARKKKGIASLRAEFEQRWGKKKEHYYPTEHLSLLADYLSENSSFHLSDQQKKDLDFEAVFSKVDHCLSPIGKQFLYAQINKGQLDEAELNYFDKIIQKISEEESIRWEVFRLFRRNENRVQFFLPHLFYGELPRKPDSFFLISNWWWLNLLLLAGSFWHVSALFGFMLSISASFFFHYKAKAEIGAMLKSFQQLSILLKIGKRLSVLLPDQVTDKHLQKCTPIHRQLGVLSADSFQNTEAGILIWWLGELLKVFFLSDYRSFYQAIGTLSNHRPDFQALYLATGQVDAAWAIASFRQEIPYWCTPQFTEKKIIEIPSLKHPLLENGVENHLHLKEKNWLITGSNMSGKTTFIRAVAINVLLAQTIRTAFAKSYISPRLHIQSCIQIEDDILNGKSYYLSEVETVKTIMEKAEKLPCLIVLDELFKGTNTIERLAINRAVLRNLHQSEAFILAATHDFELSAWLENHYETYHFSESVSSENRLHFDYQLKKGLPKERNAIKWLKVAGYPEEVVTLADQWAKELYIPDESKS